MYYPHFGLKEPPFKITPNTDFFFSGGNRGAVLDALVYAITNGEGIIKVVGEVGSGKTMLCRMLQTILPEHIESIYFANPSMAPEEVLHAIAFELQLKLPKNADRLTVMQRLQTYLLDRHAQGRQVVIFVEEAQGMPIATLEEIRLLSNLETKQDKLLQIVLFGQPELDTNLNETNIRQLRERITHSFQLGPLHTKDIGDYLIFRLRAAGYHGPHLFTASAIKKLSKAAEGLVRRVNILADKALLAAFAENLYQVTPKHVKAAIQDSEFGQKPRLSATAISIVIGSVILAICLYAWQQTTFNSYPHRAKSVVHPEAAAAKLAPSTALETSSPAALVKSSIVVAQANTKIPSENSVKSTPAEDRQITKQEITKQATPANIQDYVNERTVASQQLLQNGAPETISLQIMTVTDATQLTAQIAHLTQYLAPDKLFLYRNNQAENPYTVVLYGTFEDRAAATNAMAALPESIKNNQPQIRTIAGIKRDIH